MSGRGTVVGNRLKLFSVSHVRKGNSCWEQTKAVFCVLCQDGEQVGEQTKTADISCFLCPVLGKGTVVRNRHKLFSLSGTGTFWGSKHNLFSVACVRKGNRWGNRHKLFSMSHVRKENRCWEQT